MKSENMGKMHNQEGSLRYLPEVFVLPQDSKAVITATANQMSPRQITHKLIVVLETWNGTMDQMAGGQCGEIDVLNIANAHPFTDKALFVPLA